jgi:hypothetical protein
MENSFFRRILPHRTGVLGSKSKEGEVLSVHSTHSLTSALEVGELSASGGSLDFFNGKIIIRLWAG